MKASDAAELDGDIVEHNFLFAFDETRTRLIAVIEGVGRTVFATIDHAQAPRDLGMMMPPTTVLINGNPRSSTPS